MKARWPKAVLAVLAISLLTVSLTTWLRPREKVYQGKALSYWLRQLDAREDAIQQASASFHAIGPQRRHVC